MPTICILIGSKSTDYTVIGGTDLRDGVDKAVYVFVKVKGSLVKDSLRVGEAIFEFSFQISC